MSSINLSHSWVPPGEELLDPITKEMMTDPVIAADGHTYERCSIERWIQDQSPQCRPRSPMTNEVLVNHTLIPNHAIRGLIVEYHGQNPSTSNDAQRTRSFQGLLSSLKSKTRSFCDAFHYSQRQHASYASMNASKDTAKEKDDTGYQVFVRSLSGRTRVIDNVEDSLAIEKLKIKIQDTLGVPVGEQRLVFCGKILDNEKTVEQCGIYKHATIHLLLRVRGGGSA